MKDAKEYFQDHFGPYNHPMESITAIKFAQDYADYVMSQPTEALDEGEIENANRKRIRELYDVITDNFTYYKGIENEPCVDAVKLARAVNDYINKSALSQSRKVPTHGRIKDVCTKFFHWWYNRPGSNTKQGFDEWAKTARGKESIHNLITEKA